MTNNPNPVALALSASLPAGIPIISLAIGDVVDLNVDVNDMRTPYTVALDSEVIIQSLVDRKKTLPALAAGTYRLSWGFAHTIKGWQHKVTLTVGNTLTVLDEKSESAKDTDHTIGIAFLVVG